MPTFQDRVDFNGGWYADCAPSGEFVVAQRDAKLCITHYGIEKTDRDLLFVRCRSIKGFTFCGQDHAGTGNYEIRTFAGSSFGVNPVIYDNFGTLHQATASHQGFRFVDTNNRIWTGDETMVDPPNHLHEWSDAGGVRFGQGDEGGCVVIIDGARRLVEPGNCYFIRASYANDRYAIAITKLQENKAVLIWATREELENLPLAPYTVQPEPINRNMWLGWFQFNQDWLGPGNSQLVVRNNAGEFNTPLIVTDETLQTALTKATIGHFITGRSVEEIEERAKSTKLRPIVYWDARRWPRVPTLPNGSWMCVQAYCGKDEPLANFEQDLLGQITSSVYPIVLVGQQYTSNTTLTSDLASLIPIFTRLSKRSNVNALMLFSGAGRATGLQDHQELIPTWESVANTVGIPTFPAYNPAPTPIPPTPHPNPEPEPIPEPLIPTLKEIHMSDSKIVAIKGPAGKFASMDAPNTGPWAFLGTGWRGVLWSKDTVDVDAKFEMSKNDMGFKFKHVSTGALFGIDATKHSGDIFSQFYGKPEDNPGGYESPSVYVSPKTGMIVGFVEYDNDEGKYPSCAFSVIELD